MFNIPPINTAFMFQNWAKVTKKGAPMLPKLDIAYVIPSPVDLMLVGKVSAEIKLKRENATELDNLLSPIKTNYKY